MKRPQNFKEIMRELGLAAETPQPPPEPQDALNLSLQASKALRPRKGEASRGAAQDSARKDRQGNCARISAAAAELGEKFAASAAWETRL